MRRSVCIPTILLALCLPGISLGSGGLFSDEQIDARIQEYRTAAITLVLESPSGEVLADQDVVIEQKSHEFLFGCNVFGLLAFPVSPNLQEEYNQRFAAIFNYATLPFFWGDYEKSSGTTREETLMRMAHWCQDHGIRPKGHPLLWHELVPAWLPSDPKELEPLAEARVRGVVGRFKGLIDTFDVVNESLAGASSSSPVGRWVGKLGPYEATRRALTWAREANPEAVLVVNDFNTSGDYAAQVGKLVKNGAGPDAVGIQSHMHKGTWSDGDLWQVCERFKGRGRPIHFTELTILSGPLKTDGDWFSFHPGWASTPEGEQDQAKEVRRVYRVLFSHPSVQAITWWDLSDSGAWQGAPAGLLRKDMTPKPAYGELYKLIKQEWWTGPLHLHTDGGGRVSFRGFLGAYEVAVNGRKAGFKLEKGRPDLSLAL